MLHMWTDVSLSVNQTFPDNLSLITIVTCGNDVFIHCFVALNQSFHLLLSIEKFEIKIHTSNKNLCQSNIGGRILHNYYTRTEAIHSLHSCKSFG